MSVIRPIGSLDPSEESDTSSHGDASEVVDVQEVVPVVYDAPDTVEDDDESTELTPEDEAATIDAFLSADTREPETAIIKVSSLDAKIVVRELTERELQDITLAFEDTVEGASRARKTGRPKRKQSDLPAHIVAAALVSPNLADPKLAEPLARKYGVMGKADILKRLIRPMELATIASVVMDLSGAGDDAVEVVKNS